MSVVQSIDFEENRFKVCYSGQLLQGQAKIFFPVDTHVKAVYIKFSGKGFCKWYNGRRRTSERLTGSKTYLKETIYLISRSNAGTVLPAGDNNFPFSIQLSGKLPTSFEGTYGYIRYVASLYIESSVQKIEPLRESFTVIWPLNLNSQISFRMPVKRRVCANFNQFCFFFCWKTSNLQVYGRLPVSGYCPGQTMNLKLDVINQSDKDVLHVLVQFVKEAIYRSNSGVVKCERVVVAERRSEGCRANRIGIRSAKVNIVVPSLPATNFSTENICRCNYFLRVTAITGFCHQNPQFTMPIIIGTYPITDELYSASVSGVITEQPSRSDVAESSVPRTPLRRYPSNISVNSTDLPPYPDADPPTYEEAMRTVTTNDDFVPKYPTYKRGTKYANQDFNNWRD
ncbi:arrestin domain-containing protein 1-like [Bradysia coprophila]|uniref:arrestin domain-containing protein 1-like n=1 Tax=Bradysia coprophila TaxID=38358 RepID=UPI00187D7249|nr:arrestin domain-containing protein 1-like [Bradysia coprophila]